MSQISVKLEGLDKAIRNVDPRILRAPLRRFFERSGIQVTNYAKERSPVDTGRLRSSLANYTDRAEPPMYARIGTNVFYAPFQEFGTSRGIRPKRFLQGGFDAAMGRIRDFMRKMADEIREEFGK